MRSFIRSRAARAASAVNASGQLTSSIALTTTNSNNSTGNQLAMSRRFQYGGGNNDFGSLDSEIDAMFGKATQASSDAGYGDDGWSVESPTGQQGGGGGHGGGREKRPTRPAPEFSSICRFEKVDRVPAKFDVLTFSSCYKWLTTAKVARRLVGPMREWADEVKQRTGVHIESDLTFPDKVAQKLYQSVDDVDVTIYAFGSERSVAATSKFMESMVSQEPAYVRVGIFRRVPDSTEVEWLTLRRINSELRPPDIPPISLKLTGKYTMLFENYKDAAIRTAWEETGIALDPKLVFPSGALTNADPEYFWRVPVRYFVAELPAGAEIRGPLPSNTNYLQAWDSRILRQSPDPIDQAWGKHADPSTGTAWLKTSLLNELQKPLRGDHYMSIRYSPPPFSELQPVVNLPAITSESA